MPGPIFRWLLPIALSILAASAAPAAEGGPSLQAPLAATGGGADRVTTAGAVDAGLVFNAGMAALGAAHAPGLTEADRAALLDRAIAAFHALLVVQPDLPRVRLELARAFFLKGEDALARNHFRRVLAGNPPAPVAVNINRFLAQIRARRGRTAWFGFALAPDSNIGAGSEQDTIYINGLPFLRDDGELISSGVGVLVWAGWEGQHPLGDRTRLRFGVDLSRREFTGSAFDSMTFSGHVGPRWLASPGTEASLLAVARQHWEAGSPHYRETGLRFEGEHNLGQRTTLYGQASWFDRRYREKKPLDGHALNLSLGAAYQLTPAIKVDTGLGWGRVHTEIPNQRNAARWISAGVTSDLPRGFTLGASGRVAWTDYEGDWFPFTTTGVPRKDRTSRLRLSLHHRNFTVMGFSPKISVVHERRSSNAQLYNYRRTSGDLSFVKQF